VLYEKDSTSRCGDSGASVDEQGGAPVSQIDHLMVRSPT